MSPERLAGLVWQWTKPINIFPSHIHKIELNQLERNETVVNNKQRNKNKIIIQLCGNNTDCTQYKKYTLSYQNIKFHNQIISKRKECTHRDIKIYIIIKNMMYLPIKWFQSIALCRTSYWSSSHVPNGCCVCHFKCCFCLCGIKTKSTKKKWCPSVCLI